MRAEGTRRHVVFILIAAALFVGYARPAFAKQDWWGWLEEFSGPGPFNGYEVSLELVCINLAERRVVSQRQLMNEVTRVADVRVAGEEVVRAMRVLETAIADRRRISAAGLPNELKLGALRRQLAGVPEPGDDSAYKSLTVDLPSDFARLGLSENSAEVKALVGLRDAVIRRDESLRQAIDPIMSAVLLGRLDYADREPGIRSTRQFKALGGGLSCRGGQRRLNADRQMDRERSLGLIAGAASEGLLLFGDIDSKEIERNAKKVDEQDAEGGAGLRDIVVTRRDWQTGIVVGWGRYTSIENPLFDPNQIRSRKSGDDEPQLTLRPLEILAHSKLSSSIDIGAGFGMAFFHLSGGTPADRANRVDNIKNYAFYAIPLSVVVRPARLFTNRSWASIAGYRVSLRYFGGLSADDFGRLPTTATGVNDPPTQGRYRQNGGFIWGAAAFIDAVAAIELVSRFR